MLEHTVITASAGSGKTWSLTVRYIRLLALGAAPESIVALSFTRKSAGEFFGAIVRRLAEAADSDEQSAALARDIGCPSANRGDFRRLLATVISRMHVLALGTLDSFFVRIARSFPFELGLDGEFDLLDDYGIRFERDRVYRHVLVPDGDAAESRRAFLQAFQEATWGHEEVRLRRRLDDFVSEWHERLPEAPSPRLWGNPETIWPGGAPWRAGDGSRAELCAEVRRCLEAAEMRDSQRATWAAFLDAAQQFTPGAKMTSSFEGFLQKLLDARDDLHRGSATITVARVSQEVGGALARSLARLCDDIVEAEVMAALRRTRGVHDILSAFERHYQALVRRQGRLTFSDVQWILGCGWGTDGGGLTADLRPLIDYRLDARYHHWLLDEFQDTSRVQWRILANLCDEAIQDASGERTFFAVGDVKQSIYRWRGAEPALLSEILRHYNRHEQRIQEVPLSVSYRSGPAVIAMVNDLCGNLDGLRRFLPEGTVDAWRWDAHETAHPDRRGCAVVIESNAADEDAEDSNPAVECAVAVLQELQPLRRGLTCAVLCQTNDRARKVADLLRASTGMEVVCESDALAASDNPVTSALMALLRSGVHPGDTRSWEHVMMSPLRRVIESEFRTTAQMREDQDRQRRSAVALRILSQLAENGFERTLRWWMDRLMSVLPGMDPFSRSRMEELCRCAREFDRTASGDADGFLTFAAEWKVRDAVVPGAVQVMTVHKSKGLTFDVVILPDLDNTGRSSRAGDLVIRRKEEGEVEWLTLMPRRMFARTVPVLSDAVEKLAADLWRDRLSNLYVAVTRARYANYLIIPPPPKSPPKDGRASHPAALVLGMLVNSGRASEVPAGAPAGTLACYGDPLWYADHPVREGMTGGGKPEQLDLFAGASAPPPAPPRPRLPDHPVRPSVSRDWRAASLFRAGAAEARQHGTTVHRLLAAAEWNDAEGLAAMAAAAEGAGRESAEALAEAKACLTAPALAGLFRRPDGEAEVWRERAFDAILDGVWYSGIFDRVVIRRLPDGTIASVTLAEFKTGRWRPDKEAVRDDHRRQVLLYRAALSRLCRVPESAVRCLVVYTHDREAVEVN